MAQVVMIDAPDTISWDSGKERLALLAAIHSSDDPLLGTLFPPPAGLLTKSARDCVVKDNNVSLWTSPEPPCPVGLLLLLIFLVLLAAALLAYFIYLLLKGLPKPDWLNTVLSVVLLLL